MISSLQIYAGLDLKKLSLEEYVQLQELACKSLNIILTRYSKKFAKIAAVICGLLTKLIATTTSFANQNMLNESNLHLSLQAAQELERLVWADWSSKKYAF